MKNSKKVSIIVPVYNAEKFIDKCIQSLINQTYQNIEIILSNDGSKDNSLKKIKDWEKKYPDKIKCESHKNQGVGMTRNKGIALATGDYLTFVDSDDYLDDKAVEYVEKYDYANDFYYFYQEGEDYRKDYKVGVTTKKIVIENCYICYILRNIS